MSKQTLFLYDCGAVGISYNFDIPFYIRLSYIMTICDAFISAISSRRHTGIGFKWSSINNIKDFHIYDFL